MTVSIFIVADDGLLEDRLPAALANDQDLRIVGSARPSEPVSAALLSMAPDVVLLDLGRRGAGNAALEKIARHTTHPGILTLMDQRGTEAELQAARAGAQGALCKMDATLYLAAAVRRIAAGGLWFSLKTIEQILAEYPLLCRRLDDAGSSLARLTPSERQVLTCIAEGMTDRQIALLLGSTVPAVKGHARRVYRKLNLHNRREAAVYAARGGVGPGDSGFPA